MDTARSPAIAPKPLFVDTSLGQLRAWTVGSGPAVVVLPGLLKGPVQRARECAALFPDCSVVVLELPGLGASFPLPAGGPPQAFEAVADWLGRLDQDVALLAFDFAGPVAHALLEKCPQLVEATWLGKDHVERAARNGHRLSMMGLQWDGTHLTRLWSHLRDQDRLDPANPLRVRIDAEPYMTAEELDEAMLCFGQDPHAYEVLWNFLLDAPTGLPRLRECASGADSITALATFARRGPAFAMPPSLTRGQSIVRQYVDVSRGRVHLRRAGEGRQLVMAFLAGAGSSSNLEPLLQGLSDRFTVVAPDYLGQGDSCRAEQPTNVAQLATDAKEIAAALGFDRFSLYGTHTGAGVAIELAIAEPARVDAVVIDGISMTPPAERAEHRALYFPEISPDLWGLHLLKTWNLRRDGGYFWPWFKPVRESARKGEAPTLGLLHDRVISTLRSRSTPAYQAIASYDAAARLPLLKSPALYVAGPNDTFAAHMARAREIAPPNVRFDRVPATVWMTGESPKNVADTLQVFAEFFSASSLRPNIPR